MTSVEQFTVHTPSKYLQAAMRRHLISTSGTYDEFIHQLYLDIDEQIFDMQAGRELRQNDGEDRLSADILCGLRRHGYLAAPDTKTGGHVDLSVALGSFSWIGEAKKDGNFQEGFLQLTSRYVPASGNYSHNQGGLIFYLVQSHDARGKLDSWRDSLEETGLACVDCQQNALAFYSNHKLEGSGTNFKIRTMGVTLFHQPKDRSARNSAAKKLAKKNA